MSVTTKGQRVDCLDGLRGLAALWVLVGHAHILTGFRVPVIGDPDLGVDLFVMLSGFLMVFHFELRKTREPWEQPSTWLLFWTRRFLRIAPLYYVMLLLALEVGPQLYHARMIIDAVNGIPPQPSTRYLDDSLINHVMHLSFLFGLHPHFAYRTPLPDWSIGLEMQFYAALPFIMIIVGRLGWLRGILLTVVIASLVVFALQRLGIAFPMPSFLPLKLHVFAAGMVLAAALWMPAKRACLAGLLAAGLVLLPYGGQMSPLHHAVRLLIALGFFALVHADRLPGQASAMAGTFNRILGSRFCHHLGELSFGVYLIHLLIMQPLVAWLIDQGVMINPLRFALTLGVTIPITYGLAFVGYRFIELPGQAVARSLTRRATMSGDAERNPGFRRDPA